MKDELFGIQLVSDIFPVGEEGEEIIFGFSVASQKVRYEISEALQQAPVSRGVHGKGPAQYSGIDKLLTVRVKLIRSSIRNRAWHDILNVALPDRLWPSFNQ